MLNEADVVYEISFGVADAEEFEAWFPDASVEWGTLPGVQTFRVYRGVDGETERIRLVFGFADSERWHSFVRTACHREHVATLESVGQDVQISLWSPSAVTLTGEGSAVVDVDQWMDRPIVETEAMASNEDAVPGL